MSSQLLTVMMITMVLMKSDWENGKLEMWTSLMSGSANISKKIRSKIVKDIDFVEVAREEEIWTVLMKTQMLIAMTAQTFKTSKWQWSRNIPTMAKIKTAFLLMTF